MVQQLRQMKTLAVRISVSSITGLQEIQLYNLILKEESQIKKGNNLLLIYYLFINNLLLIYYLPSNLIVLSLKPDIVDL